MLQAQKYCPLLSSAVVQVILLGDSVVFGDESPFVIKVLMLFSE